MNEKKPSEASLHQSVARSANPALLAVVLTEAILHYLIERDGPEGSDELLNLYNELKPVIDTVHRRYSR